MKQYTVIATRRRNGKETLTGPLTIPELVKYFGYTLECGKAYECEKGNRKINIEPKTIDALITNLNNAANNAASDGWGSTSYSLGE